MNNSKIRIINNLYLPLLICHITPNKTNLAKMMKKSRSYLSNDSPIGLDALVSMFLSFEVLKEELDPENKGRAQKIILDIAKEIYDQKTTGDLELNYGGFIKM